jgi:hypothetical protein
MLKALYEQPVDLVMNVAAWGVEQAAAAVRVARQRIGADAAASAKRSTKRTASRSRTTSKADHEIPD